MILLLSEISVFSIPAGAAPCRVTVKGPGGTVFDNSYNCDCAFDIPALDAVLRLDMDRTDSWIAHYLIEARRGDSVVASVDADFIYTRLLARADRDMLERDFLMESRELTMPAAPFRDGLPLIVPVVSDTSCSCSITVVTQKSQYTLDWPLASGGDEVQIHNTVFEERPAVALLVCGARRLKVNYLAPQDDDGSVHTFRFRNAFNNTEYLTFRGMTETSESADRQIVSINRSSRIVSSDAERSYTLNVSGVSHDAALAALSLVHSREVCLMVPADDGLLDPVEIIVSDVSGDISDNITSLSSFKISYSFAKDLCC